MVSTQQDQTVIQINIILRIGKIKQVEQVLYLRVERVK